MPDLKLEGGNTYHLKITKYQKRNKQFPKKDGFMYMSYHVGLEDKHGNTVQAEFITREEKPEAFVEGCWQYVRCGIVGTIGMPEVEPAEDPTLAKQPEHYSDIPKNAAPANCYAQHIAGKSFTFAMGYAKDILLAEIARWPEKRRVTQKDIKRMFGWANDINNKMCDRINF